MSSYWGANYGDALVLSQSEFDDFCEKYAKKHGLIKSILFDEETIEEYPFVSSKEKNENFWVTEINADNCDDMYLIPFVFEGRPNVRNKETCQLIYSINLRHENCYAIFAKHCRYGMNAFMNPPYDSYESMKQEFIDDLSEYLPENFDWDKHIGSFSYASYS